MFCPRCRVEYRPGFSICSDCNVELVAALPPEPKRQPHTDADEDLPVYVWETFDPGALAVAKSILKGAGITYCVGGENFTRLVSYSSPLLGYNPAFGGYRVQVSSGNAPAAVELLRDVTERRFF